MSSREQLHITKQKQNTSQLRLNSSRIYCIAIAQAFIFRLYWFRLLSVWLILLGDGLNIGFITIALRCLSLLLEPGFSCEDILARRYINITSFIVNSGNIQIQIRLAVIRSKFCIVAFLTVDSHIGLVSVNDKVSLTKRQILDSV